MKKYFALFFVLIILSGCSYKSSEDISYAYPIEQNTNTKDEDRESASSTNLSEQMRLAREASKNFREDIAEDEKEKEEQEFKYYNVVEVEDSDTVLVKINDKDEEINLLGANYYITFFSDNPDATAITYNCFKQKSLNKLKEILDNKKVRLELDPRGSFNSLSGKYYYVYLEDGTLVNQLMIKNGYAIAGFYTSYKYESEFKALEKKAKDSKLGLWKSSICDNEPTLLSNSYLDCWIKGNISYNTGEKIYHLPGCEYYDATTIDERYGEKWFCTEKEAINAGWRKAYTCP